MIITILPNSQNFHAVAYNERKVSQGLAELMEVSNFPTLTPANYNADNFRDYLDSYSKRNDRIKNAQFHFSVSCKGTEFSHLQLLDIARLYMKEMGYGEEGQPVLVYAHHDTPNNHIHVITSRIAPNGRKISKEFEKKRSRQVTQKIVTASDYILSSMLSYCIKLTYNQLDTGKTKSAYFKHEKGTTDKLLTKNRCKMRCYERQEMRKLVLQVLKEKAVSFPL